MRSAEPSGDSPAKSSPPHQHLHPASAASALHPRSMLSSQLLPPPPLPISRTTSASSIDGDADKRPPVVPAQPPTPPAPQSGNQPSPFNFGEFINVSPSPRVDPQTAVASGALKGSLRADIGRKLFEEEQMKQQHVEPASVAPAALLAKGTAQELEAGINLVQG